MVTLLPKSSRTGKTLTRVAVGLGLVGACTVVDKGDYTFTDNPDATGGEAGGGTGGAQGGASGSSGNSGSAGTSGEGGEATGGRGGTGGATSGDGGGGTGGADEGCDPNPCEHGGECTSSAGVVTCRCAAGYDGDTCGTNIDECDPNPCLNNAVCRDEVADFVCACPPSVTGKKCELPRFETIVMGQRSYARSVSADGTIVLGGFYDGAGMERPYFWSTGNNPEPAMVPMDLAQSHVTPLSLSRNGEHWVGQVLLTTMTNVQPMPAGGSRTQYGMFLPPQTAFAGAIIDVNHDGTKSVGYVDDGAGFGVHAFTWDDRGRPMPLMPPMVGMTQYFVAGAVTPDGTIVTGSYLETAGTWFVVAWADLGATPPPLVRVSGGAAAVAVHGVSADGQVTVGTFRDAAQQNYAFVTEQTRFNNITPQPSGTIPPVSNAWDISDDGSVIVGDVDNSGMTGGMSLEAVVWPNQAPYIPTPIAVILRNNNVDLKGHTLRTATGVSADGKVVVGEAWDMPGNRVGYIARLP